MRRKLLLTVLAVITLGVAASSCVKDMHSQTCAADCSADGQLGVDVKCKGVACGKQGIVSAQLRATSCTSPVIRVDSSASVSLSSSGAPASLGWSPLPTGTYCVSAELSSGGQVFVSSSGARLVSVGLSANVAITIDTAGP